ncbi:HtaA domain-containing protein [Microcella frigidaquae]|uniref:Htaa domain-containing protein n=1 Tax=Microcella frigidaquae TaxID=424758 RepID=A0A840XLE1_9MICO|nr:HtaA domain-containing protein [Microcella frigidaquae]MBB5617667.1 hypothetical protein [Microcella frigidaquae]NHN45682.1 hypothetical protein [Microcella frigidaquae]
MLAALALTASLVAAPASACVATEGGFDWGFKESFRAYLSGSIANGAWTTEGGIGYETPVFTTDALEGDLALAPLSGELAVDGAMRFTGHEGILDTTISNVRLGLVDGQRLELVVDLRGTTQEFVEVDTADVLFATGDLAAAAWTAGDDGLLIAGIPLTLTEQGAEAFGTYPAGEALDPLDLRLTTTADCAEQAIAARQSGAGMLAPLLIVGVVLIGVAASVVVHLRLRAAKRRSHTVNIQDE